MAQGSHRINLPLFFASDTNVSVAAGAALTISDPTTIRAGKTVTKSGTVLIEALLTLEAEATLVIDNGNTVLIDAPGLGAGARIDLRNSSLIVDYSGRAMPAAVVKAQIGNNAIMSSSVVIARTGVGWKNDASDESILVKCAYLGDTNLDAQVDVTDLGNLAAAWQTSGDWVNGDSNYDGFVDIADLGALATNWLLGADSPLRTSFDESAARIGLPALTVPEPNVLTGIELSVVGLLRCRRRDLRTRQ